MKEASGGCREADGRTQLQKGEIHADVIWLDRSCGGVVGARGVIVVLLIWAEKNDHGDGFGGGGRDEMGFNKGVGSWAADDAGDAGSGVGAGKRRLDACVELLDLGRLMLVDRRWVARDGAGEEDLD
ncbi:hypothetical protein ACLOJK_005981 [Asimina triloba]